MAKATICYIGPISIHSYRLIEAFSRKGYRLALITDSKAWIAPEFNKSATVLVLPVLTQSNFLERFVPNNLRVMKILMRIRPDLVHLHAQHQYSLGISFSGFPFILNSWGLEVLELPTANSLRRVLAKGTGHKARKIIVDARILKGIWKTMGIASSKIDVIPFGVDINVFNPRVDGLHVRSRLRVKETDVVIISTRPFYDGHYNIECLIRAIPSIVRNHSNAKFIIKGSGPREKYLIGLAKELGVLEHVRFVGLVPHREVAQYLRAADIYLSTSFVDSTSVSLLEAMACGLAPVVTSIPGNREWVQNEVNGLLFPPKDQTALAEKIAQLIEHEDLRRQFGEKSHRIVVERATWEDCVFKIEAIYEELLEQT